MVQLHPNFRKTITTHMDQRVRAAYDEMRGLAACAGIRNNDNAAHKVRVNHHGSFSKCVPARRFIDAAIEDTELYPFNEELREVIRSLIQAADPRQISGRTWEMRRTKLGAAQEAVEIQKTEHHTSPFGQKGMGPRRLMNKIAKQMLDNQIRSLQLHSFPAGEDYGNDPAHNTPRVAKKKGFDFPMVRTGEVVRALDSWVEG